MFLMTGLKKMSIFKKDEYKDTKEYIYMMGCSYFFNEIPLKELGIDFL